MLSFKLQSWNALAPGLEDKSAWREWLLNPVGLAAEMPKISLKQIPPMLRRRFTDLGKCAAGAALPLLEDIDAIPGVFASRHGDTHLTLSLLEGIAEKEPMSPTGFSLAVHNAFSGLLSIARKDVSEVTAIASQECLIPHALMEAATQLQDRERVLCIIYDVPLPELYQPYSEADPYPFAIAMVLSREEGEGLALEHLSGLGQKRKTTVSNSVQLMRFLTGLDNQISFYSELQGSSWRISRV